MRRSTFSKSVSIFTLVLSLSAFAASIRAVEPESRAPIILGPGVTAVNVEEPFSYFMNPWTVIAPRDYPSGTRISPRGELLLSGGVVVRPLVGESLLPLHRRIARTLRKGWLPIVKMDFVLTETLRITTEACAEPFSANLPGISPTNYRNHFRATLRNVGREPVRGRIGFAWQPEVKIELRRHSASDPGKAPPGEKDGKGGIVASGDRMLATWSSPSNVELGAEGSRIIAEAALPPGEERSFDLCLFFEPVVIEGAPSAEAALAAGWRGDEVARDWEDFLGKRFRLSIGERKVEETFKASLVYQFIGRDGKELHAGEGFYDELYLRDGAYQSISLAQAGFLDEARDALECFLRFQKPDGQMVSQEGQLDANGYAMWVPVEFAKLSGDLAFLKRFYGPIKRAAEYAMKARRIEKDPGSPTFGVLPNAISDGEYLWAGENRIVGYDWWNLRGIGCVAEAARMLGEAKDAEIFEAEFNAYRKDIVRALERTGLPYIPPSYEKVGTHWGNLEVVFPTQLLDPFDPRVSATLAHVRNEFGQAGGAKGLVEGTLQWNPGVGAIHPYMSQFVVNTHIIRGEQAEAVDGFYSMLLHSTATHGFPEGVYYLKREAWGDTLPHLWAAAMYEITLRNMILREDGDALHLLSAVPAGWLEPGKTLSFSRAPTHFGRVDLEVGAVGDDGLRVRLERLEKDRAAPRRIVIHFPPSFAIVEARKDTEAGSKEGTRLEAKDGTIILSEARGCDVFIELRRDRAAPAPDFAAKLASYLAEAPELDRPIPGLVTGLPAHVPLDRCVKLDLAPLATTNPLDRPFLANGPAFAGIPLGDTRVAGIPFRTLDPAKHGGKGLVILQGVEACAGLPREAVVPAGGVVGKYLCILGNVTGWGPGDPGTGKWGAVGEYEIRYADGTRQSIPLVTGRTCDDWLGAPGASESAGVLQVAHWHLNVLAIQLEAKPVESVIARDLGTPASPVVAAMTIVP